MTGVDQVTTFTIVGVVIAVIGVLVATIGGLIAVHGWVLRSAADDEATRKTNDPIGTFVASLAGRRNEVTSDLTDGERDDLWEDGHRRTEAGIRVIVVGIAVALPGLFLQLCSHALARGDWNL